MVEDDNVIECTLEVYSETRSVYEEVSEETESVYEATKKEAEESIAFAQGMLEELMWINKELQAGPPNKRKCPLTWTSNTGQRNAPYHNGPVPAGYSTAPASPPQQLELPVHGRADTGSPSTVPDLTASSGEEDRSQEESGAAAAGDVRVPT
jgi:hypothetical protein